MIRRFVHRSRWPWSLLLALVLGCGGGGSGGNAPVPPAIQTAPASQTVVLGSTVTLSVVASGTPPLSYLWRKDGVALAGAVASSVIITSAQPADGGSYSVVVTNPAGSATSPAAVLVVLVPPSITVQPAGAVIQEGRNAVLSVAAEGSAPLRFQWRKNGVPISGASADSISFLPATSSDSGRFDVVVWNPAGTVTSAVANLEVGVPPSVAQAPTALAVHKGQPGRMSVGVAGTAPLKIQWQHDGVDLPGFTSQDLVIPSTGFQDEGAYAAKISNPWGEALSPPATLTVLPSATPRFAVAADYLQVPEGGQAVFAVSGPPTGTAAYQWRKDGVPIPGASGPALVLVASRADQGAYSVRVKDQVDEDETLPTALSVLATPAFQGVVEPGPTLAFPRYSHKAVLLRNGDVLLTGGADPNGQAVPAAEVFHPSSGTVQTIPGPSWPAYFQPAILLRDGRVLLSGGVSDGRNVPLGGIEAYDPVRGNFSPLGQLKVPRSDHQMLQLPNGKVLIIGGTSRQFPTPCEVLDLATGISETIPSGGSDWWGGISALLGPRGEGIICGGTSGLVASARIAWYQGDPPGWTPLPGLRLSRSEPTVHLLRNGNLAIVGGVTDYGQPFRDSAEVRNLDPGGSSYLRSLKLGRAMHSSVLLADGRILVVGGAAEWAGGGLPEVELFDPSNAASMASTPLQTGRYGHTATRLKDGRVLVAGGSNGRGALSSTEILR